MLCRTFALALAAGLAVTSPAHSQSFELQDDIDFSQNLARYRLFDLASDFLNEVDRRDDLDADDRLALLYARALVSKIGGDFAVDSERRLEFYDQASQLFESFLKNADEDHPNHENARVELAAGQRNNGALLAELVADGVDTSANQTKAEAAFRASVRQLNEIFNEKQALMEALLDSDDPPEGAEEEDLIRDTFRPKLQLAETYYEWGLLYGPGEFNREDYLTKCIDAATEYIWEIGSEDFSSLQVYRFDALAHIKMGQLEEGITRLDYIMSEETGYPSILEYEGNDELPPGDVKVITRNYERAFLALAEALNDAGRYSDMEKRYETLQAYYDKYKRRGGGPTDIGDEVLLQLGIAKFRMGKADGMKVLEQVAERHADDQIGRLAAGYISKILEGGGASSAETIPASVWMTAAAADQDEGNLLDAIEKYHRAIAGLDTISDEEERTRTAIEAWNTIGNIYRSEKRYLEAAAAFRQGLDVTGAGKSLEDTERLGVAWYNTLLARQRETKSKRDGQKKDAAMRQLSSMGIENMAFLVAKDDFEAARILPPDSDERGQAFKAAIKKLKAVKTSDMNYERSLVYLARAEAAQGKWEDALKRLATYEKWIADDKHDPGLDRKKIQAREISHTEATYYRSTYEAELGRHEDVLKTLGEFETKFPNQTKFFSLVNYQRLRSLLELPDLDRAQQLFEEKQEELPPESEYYLARAFLDAGKPAEPDGEPNADLLRRGGDHLYHFCEQRGFDSYPNLKASGDAFRQIEDYPRAQAIYEKTLSEFSDDARWQKEVDRSLKLDLAAVLLAQRDFVGAAAYYKELVKLHANKREVLRSAALGFGGWVDIIDNAPVEVPGSGDYKDALELWDQIVERGFERDQKYSPPWWEAKYYSMYSRYRAREVDPTYLKQAQDLLQNLESTVLALYPEDEHRELLGGSDWQKRFNYLRDRLQ